MLPSHAHFTDIVVASLCNFSTCANKIFLFWEFKIKRNVIQVWFNLTCDCWIVHARLQHDRLMHSNLMYLKQDVCAVRYEIAVTFTVLMLRCWSRKSLSFTQSCQWTRSFSYYCVSNWRYHSVIHRHNNVRKHHSVCIIK